HLGFNGPSNVWQALQVPATGGWQAWTTISTTATLGAGTQQITLAFDTGGFNVASIQVSSSSSTSTPSGTSTSSGSTSAAAYGGTPASIPGTIQAANFDNGGQGVAYGDTTSGNTGGAYRQTDVDIETSSEGGYDVGWIAAGEWLNFTVKVATA